MGIFRLVLRDKKDFYLQHRVIGVLHGHHHWITLTCIALCPPPGKIQAWSHFCFNLSVSTELLKYKSRLPNPTHRILNLTVTSKFAEIRSQHWNAQKPKAHKNRANTKFEKTHKPIWGLVKKHQIQHCNNFTKPVQASAFQTKCSKIERLREE